jgi:hypothetical protein
MRSAWDIPTGLQLKLDVMRHHEATKADYLAAARSFAINYSRIHGSVSINEVREAVPVPDDVHPSVLGAVFRGHQWLPDGYTVAKHPSAHARTIRTYKYRGDISW